MEVYTLRFSDDEFGVARRLEFKARNMNEALVIAHREAAMRRVELWHGDRMLGIVELQAHVAQAPLEPQKYRAQSALAGKYRVELPRKTSGANASMPERCHAAR